VGLGSILLLGVNRRVKQNGQEKPMKDEKETAQLEKFSFDRVQSSLFESDAPAEKVLFSLPEFKKQEMAGALRDFH
jgi:CRISPR/Cas system-associated endoribonuclease Cas2